MSCKGSSIRRRRTGLQNAADEPPRLSGLFAAIDLSKKARGWTLLVRDSPDKEQAQGGLGRR